MSHFMVRATRGIRRRRIQKSVSYSTITTRGLENVSSAIADNSGVMIAANHSAHWDSEAIYCALDKIDQPTFILTAWQIFGGCSTWQQWLIRSIGCFSIDREGSDRNAFKESVRILRKEKRPLLIFPEGDIFHTNDRITCFREGMASIAMSAARSEDRPVVIIPCAVKLWFLDDPKPSLKRVLTRLEERLTLRPAHRLPLTTRIVRIAGAALSLKEIEYRGKLTTGTLHQRRNNLMEFILRKLESDYGRPVTTEDARERVKNLRQIIIKRADEELKSNRPKKAKQVELYRLQMEDLFTVTQLYSYPEDYLADDPPIERIAETIDKLEEDLDFAVLPTIHGRKRVEISFGEPIRVEPTRDRDAMSKLTTKTCDTVQSMIDSMTRTD